MARHNNKKSTKGMKKAAQRGIGTYSLEDIQQRVSAVKAKTAVSVAAKKPAEAILEVLATPDQTPGPTPTRSTASSRSNTACLDSTDGASYSASAHVSSLSCESGGSTSSFLEDVHLQVTISEGTPAHPLAELTLEGGQQNNSSPADHLSEDKWPAASTTEADLPAETINDKLSKASAAVAVVPTMPLQDNSDTVRTDQSKTETLPHCHELSSPPLMDNPMRQDDAWSTRSRTSSPSITAAVGTSRTLLPPGNLATVAPGDDYSPTEPPSPQDTPPNVCEDVPAPATAPTAIEPPSVDQRPQVAPKESRRTSPQLGSWLASKVAHICSWVQAACTRWLMLPQAPKAATVTVQPAAAAPHVLTAALDTAWHFQLLT